MFSCFSQRSTISSTKTHDKPTITYKPRSDFKQHKVAAVVTNVEQPEGSGVTVKRSIGSWDFHYISPFALLDHFNLEEDYKGYFSPHPHRGMSTFTYILPKQSHPTSGVKHRDHKGNSGIIGAGDVQYMEAGKGIVHSEVPASRHRVEGLQLWINLPLSHKMVEASYQEYKSDELPTVEKNGIHAKVIMGEALGAIAKVKTRTPVHYIHYTMKPNTILEHSLPSHWNTLLYGLNGDAVVDNKTAKAGQTVVFDVKDGNEQHKNKNKDKYKDAGDDLDIKKEDNEGGVVVIAGDDGYEFILISGEPLTDGAEVVGAGPMLVTSDAEVDEAWDDYYNGVNGFEGAKEFKKKWKLHD